MIGFPAPCWGSTPVLVKTAPFKPSAQTRYVLDAMSVADRKQDERWETIQESLDLLFAKMSTVEQNQHQMREQLNLNSTVIDQSVRDQLTLAKQLAETGNVVAQLRLNKRDDPIYDEVPGSPKSDRSVADEFFTQHDRHCRDPEPHRRGRVEQGEPSHARPKREFRHRNGDNEDVPYHLPKM